MFTNTRLILATMWLCFVGALGAGAAQAATHTLQNRLDAPSRPGDSSPRTAAERNTLGAIRSFYSQRDHRPLWFENGKLSLRGKALLKALAEAGEHGLRPALYRAEELAKRAAEAGAGSIADIDLALTRAYLDYAGDISSGVIDNPRRTGETFRDAKRPPPQKLLDEIAKATDVNGFFALLPPDTRRYNALKAALAKYRQFEKSGGWPIVSKGPTLKPGMKGERVAQVKRRLLVTGELAELGEPGHFGDDLVAAVKAFQRRHGLNDDGTVGVETLAAMNVPVSDRIAQLIINLERRRWLGAQLGDRYIYVNIADNDLKVVEKDKTVHVARVVVGKPFHQTPVFSALMTYIEINPYWNVPYGIAMRDLLPKIKANPGFLSANDYLLLTRSGDNSSAINPASVDWSTITPRNFPFTFRQKPGPKNALGTMAFMFPNPHNVFIHDTPTKSLFNVEDRYFSNGCVRVQYPMKLALLLLAGQNGGQWTVSRIKSIIETDKQTRIELKKPIQVHITYLTVWADSDGTVQFRKDLYKRDDALTRAIRPLALVR